MTPPAAGARPVRGASLLHRVLEGEAVIYDRANRQVHHLNRTATEFWTRCDGSRTVDAIVDELTSAFDAPRETVEADVLALAAELVDSGLLTRGMTPDEGRET